MQGYSILKSFLMSQSILFIILFSQTAHAKFNEQDEDFASDYSIQLILDGILPIANFIYQNEEWKPCNFQSCIEEAEEKLILILNQNTLETKADKIKALVLEKELRRHQSYSKTDFKHAYFRYKEIELDFVDLFKNDYFELASFYAYFGGFSQVIDENSNTYLEKSIQYFKKGLKQEFDTDNYYDIDWVTVTSEDSLMWLYVQKLISDFTYANTALIMNKIKENNIEYKDHKTDLLKLFAALPPSLMWTFKNPEDYYLHSVGTFEYAAHVQVSNVTGMKEYADQLTKYCDRTEKARLSNELMQRDGTTDNCRILNLTYAKVLLLEENQTEALKKIEAQFESFESMAPYDQLDLLSLMISNSIYSLLPIKDMYETAISIGSKMGLADYDPQVAYWMLDYLYLLRSEQNAYVFASNLNNIQLYKNAKNLLVKLNSKGVKDDYSLSVLFHIDAAIAEMEYLNVPSQDNIKKINLLIDKARVNQDLLLDWRSEENYPLLVGSLVKHYTEIDINFNKANLVINKLLEKNPEHFFYLGLKSDICKKEKDYSCAIRYKKNSIKILKNIQDEISSDSDTIGLMVLVYSRSLFSQNHLLAELYVSANKYTLARNSYLESLNNLFPFANVPSDDLVQVSFEMINEHQFNISDAINEILLIDYNQKNKLSHKEFDTLFMATQFLHNSNVSKAIISMVDRMSFTDDKIKILYKTKQDLESEIAKIRNNLNANSMNLANAKDSKKLTKDFNLLKKELRKTNTLLKSSLPFNNKIIVNKLMDLYELQSKLKKNEALLIYNTKGDSNFSWVITNNDYVITPLGDYDLKKNINLTRQSIDNKFLNQNSTFDYHSSEKLYETLIKPITSFLKNKNRIFILADSDLMSIPLDVLPSESKFNKEKNNWLIKKYSITNLPNINLISERIVLSKDFNEFTFLGVGDPKLNKKKITNQNINEIIAQKDFLKNIFRDSKIADITKLDQIAELPETTQELTKISSYFNSNNVDLLLRDDANESKLKRLQLDKYNILSFATHTIPRTEENKLSEPGLLLSLPNKASYENDGILTASEITQMTLNADLVVLSACDTAQNIESNNTISGLIDSFIYAGSKAIIASHWPVESNSTVTLMTTTFDNWLGNGLNLDEALQKAKLDIMTKKEYSHPMYWASFSIYGGL